MKKNCYFLLLAIFGLVFYANSAFAYGGGGSSARLARPIANPPVVIPVSAPTNSPGQVLGVETFRFSESIDWKSRGDDVLELQKILKEKSLYNGRIDGIFGPMTSSALKKFQIENNLAPVGVVGPSTRVALNNHLSVRTRAPNSVALSAPSVSTQKFKFEKNIKFGARNGEVAELQKTLNRLGFDAGKEDGIFWQKTLSAVKEFQTKNNLAAVGLVGPKTRELLNKLNQ